MEFRRKYRAGESPDDEVILSDEPRRDVILTSQASWRSFCSSTQASRHAAQVETTTKIAQFLHRQALPSNINVKRKAINEYRSLSVNAEGGKWRIKKKQMRMEQTEQAQTTSCLRRLLWSVCRLPGLPCSLLAFFCRFRLVLSALSFSRRRGRTKKKREEEIREV